MTDIKEKLRFATKNYWTMAQTKCDKIQGMSAPSVRFVHGGTAGGSAHGSEHWVKYNTALAERHPGEFLRQIVGHEVAHIVAHHYGGKGHGRTWKTIMRLLGLQPDRCHSLDTSDVRLRRPLQTFTYTCDCKEHQVTSIRHKRVLMHELSQGKRGAQYKCGRCQKTLIEKRHET